MTSAQEWCVQQGAWIRWSVTEEGFTSVDLAVAHGDDDTDLLTVTSESEMSPDTLLWQAVSRMRVEQAAQERRAAFHCV